MTMIGQEAPLFKTTAIINGQEVIQDFSLKQFKGHKEVIFFFYPKDFTFVCPTELVALQEALSEFEQRGVAVIGCSTDTAETHLRWLRTPKQEGGIEGVTYPLIADVSKEIAASYRVITGKWAHPTITDELEFVGADHAYRATFLIDKQGIIRHYSVNDFALGRSIPELLRIIDMWQHVQEFGEVCPINWVKGEQAMKENHEGLLDYLRGN